MPSRETILQFGAAAMAEVGTLAQFVRIASQGAASFASDSASVFSAPGGFFVERFCHWIRNRWSYPVVFQIIQSEQPSGKTTQAHAVHGLVKYTRLDLNQ